MKWLILHGHIFDPSLDTPAKQWVVEELDRISNILDIDTFNRLRVKIQSEHSADNVALIEGAARLGYNTICGHSHLAEGRPRFINDGCWLTDRQPHYVLFPRDKVAVISDLHIGTGDYYAKGSIVDFLTFAKEHGWHLILNGDILDLWAHPLADIIASDGDLLSLIIWYPSYNLILGNHDNDQHTMEATFGKPSSWWHLIDTDDTPTLVGWPNTL